MDFTQPQKLEYRYCLKCEETIILDLGKVDGQELHTVIDWDGDEYGCEADYRACFGPFTSCPPPDVPEDFDLVELPSEEELAEMNLSAEMLLQELEG